MGSYCTIGTFGHVRKERHFLKVVAASARGWLGAQMHALLGVGLWFSEQPTQQNTEFCALCIKTPISILWGGGEWR